MDATAPAIPASTIPARADSTPQPQAASQPAYPAPPSYGAYPTYPTYPTYPNYPTYPGYPTAQVAPAQPYPAPAYQAQPGVYPYPSSGYGAYGYPPNYGSYGSYGYYPYFAPMYPAKPRRTPSETYALVIAWIVTGLSALSVLCGLLISLFMLIAIFFGLDDDLSVLGGTLGFWLAPLLGGGLGLWYGIRGIMRRPSPRFQLPSAWAMLALTLAAIGAALALWSVNQSLGRAPGAAFGVLPLAALTGALPALAILAFTTQRLRDPSTRRHVWMSLFYGMTLAPLIAVILEGILTLIIIAALGLAGQDAQAVQRLTGGDSSPRVTLAMFLVLSVVAPLVEEGVKPLGALLAVRRLRAPGEMFLVGLAAGIGFDMFETIGYIGQGQADWVSVAIERIGAGLLHGVGAGMCALGWYYLINGQGVSLRWLRAVGCFAYAVVQHSVFNAFSLANYVLPSNVNDWLIQPFYLWSLPLQRWDFVFVGVYAFILTVLIIMTSRLLGAKGMPAPPAPAWPTGGYPYAPYTPVPWSYGLAPAPAPTASAIQASQTAGGAR